MAGLSDRLAMMASLVQQGERVADVGTDHGSLPIFLCQQGISPFGVMTDISADSLRKAQLAGSQWIEEGKLSARCGDGLVPLEKGEVDTVMLAGMGGRLMIDILEADPEKTLSFRHFIFQPRTAPGELRSYLAAKGYHILEEKLVRERKNLCEILWVQSPAYPLEEGQGEWINDPSEGARLRYLAEEAEKSSPRNTEESLEKESLAQGPLGETSFTEGEEPKAEAPILWEVPLYYRDLEEPLMEEYLQRKWEREKRILQGRTKSLQGSSSQAAEESDVQGTKENMAYLQALLQARIKGQ